MSKGIPSSSLPPSHIDAAFLYYLRNYPTYKGHFIYVEGVDRKFKDYAEVDANGFNSFVMPCRFITGRMEVQDTCYCNTLLLADLEYEKGAVQTSALGYLQCFNSNEELPGFVLCER